MTDTLTPQALAEAGALVESQGPGRARIRIIEAGQGSSGTYLEETLRDAANRQVFSEGTLMFLDHPAASETSDRPERSVRDLAGRLTSDAVYEDGALVADAEVFAHMRPIIEGLAESIGVSIRAMGDINEAGEVVAITEARSVDYVTEAGAGGRVLELIESARSHPLREARNAGQWIESNLHLQFTEMTDRLAANGHLTRDERMALSSAIGDALTAFNAAVADQAPHLYERDPFGDPDEGTYTGSDSVPAVETTRRDRVGTGAPEGADTEGGSGMAETTETGVPATEGRDTGDAQPSADLTEANRRIEALERQLAERDARDEVRRHVTEHAADLPDAARGRVAGSVDLHADDLETQVTEAVARERAYIAEVSGTGAVRGMGGGDPIPDNEEAFEALEAEFQRSGLDEAAAKAAARA